MAKHLESVKRLGSSGQVRASHKGWSAERRARQAALIRGWQPWRRSTGPKTEAGKARSAANALKHGFRSRETVEKLRRVNHALQLAARNTSFLRLLIRIRNAHRRIRATSLAVPKHGEKLLAPCTGRQDSQIRANERLDTGILQRGQVLPGDPSGIPSAPRRSTPQGIVAQDPSFARRLRRGYDRRDPSKEPAMSSDTLTRVKDKFVTVDGLRT